MSLRCIDCDRTETLFEDYVQMEVPFLDEWVMCPELQRLPFDERRERFRYLLLLWVHFCTGQMDAIKFLDNMTALIDYSEGELPEDIIKIITNEGGALVSPTSSPTSPKQQNSNSPGSTSPMRQPAAVNSSSISPNAAASSSNNPSSSLSQVNGTNTAMSRTHTDLSTTSRSSRVILSIFTCFIVFVKIFIHIINIVSIFKFKNLYL